MLEKSHSGTTDVTTTNKFLPVAAPLSGNAASVKFAHGLSKTAENIAIPGQPSKAAALPLPPPHHQTTGRPPNSKWGYRTHRIHRFKQAGIIQTGSLIGLPKRRPTNRALALDIDQVRALANAHAFARNTCHPFNAMLTITWRFTPQFTENEWASLQTKVMDQTTRFLRRHGITTAYAWTRERVPGRGAHTHVALHLGTKPANIRPELLKYLNRKFEFAQGGLDITMGKYGAHSKDMQAGTIRYIAKGLDHSAFRYNGKTTENIGMLVGIDHRGQQGLITIKRAGVSQNVSQKARKKAGWQDIRDFEGLRRILHPTAN